MAGVTQDSFDKRLDSCPRKRDPVETKSHKRFLPHLSTLSILPQSAGVNVPLQERRH